MMNQGVEYVFVDPIRSKVVIAQCKIFCHSLFTAKKVGPSSASSSMESSSATPPKMVAVNNDDDSSATAVESSPPTPAAEELFLAR
ncbi:unnamed protein product [Linum trigynum]|uniref:Uncharacterized protein n=1 Tax=Linum trigynum TaxID=586398 RepID=A0AAV2DZ84_9ROSI